EQLLQQKLQEAGIEAPSGAGPQGSVDALRNLHDRQFDEAYMTNQVQAHEKAVALFHQEAQAGQNESLKGFAQFALPALRAHLAQAKQLSAVFHGTTTSGREQSVRSAGPPATAAQVTTSDEQSPMIKEMNDEAKDRLEKEGK